MLKTFFIIVSILCTNSLSAVSVEEASKAYDQGDFAAAISIYENLISSGLRHGSLYYNLGNSYFRKGEKGKAVAAYLAARRLMPRNPDVKANLKFVEEQGPDKLAPHLSSALLRNLAFWVDYASPKEVLWVSAILGCLGLSLLFLTLVFAKLIFLRPWSLAMSLLACLSLGIFISSLYFEETWGAVSVPLAEVHSGPGETNTVVFQLHEGAPFVVDALEPGWYRIQLSDAKLGWLAAKDATVFLF